MGMAGSRGTTVTGSEGVSKERGVVRLLNFKLEKPSFGIELLGLGFVWDLHNSGEFVGVEFIAESNTVVMKWSLLGHLATKYSGCDLVFKNLKQMVVTPRDEALPLSEDRCVSGVSMVVPDGDAPAQYRIKSAWNTNDPFGLLFEFQSGRSIEIEAETVELVAVRTVGSVDE
jgi:hypothetical protein